MTVPSYLPFTASKQIDLQEIRMNHARLSFFAAIAGAALLLGGCTTKSSPTPENYTKALNTYFADRPECLLPDGPRFPLETTDPGKTRQLNALASAKLLEVKEEKSIHVSRYTLTPAGQRMAPRFCYGHREIVSIDGSTPPAQANGFPETQVAYTYKIVDVPVWAKDADVQAAFPDAARAMNSTSTGKITLARTMAGWSVPE